MSELVGPLKWLIYAAAAYVSLPFIVIGLAVVIGLPIAVYAAWKDRR